MPQIQNPLVFNMSLSEMERRKMIKANRANSLHRNEHETNHKKSSWISRPKSRRWKLKCCWIVTVNNVDCCHYFILEQITIDALIRTAEPCLPFEAFGIVKRKTKQNEENLEKKKEMKNNSSKIKFTKDLWIYVYYILKWWRRMWKNLSKKSKSDWLRFSCTRWWWTVNNSKMNRNHIEKYNKQQDPKMRITTTAVTTRKMHRAKE